MKRSVLKNQPSLKRNTWTNGRKRRKSWNSSKLWRNNKVKRSAKRKKKLYYNFLKNKLTESWKSLTFRRTKRGQNWAGRNNRYFHGRFGRNGRKLEQNVSRSWEIWKKSQIKLILKTFWKERKVNHVWHHYQWETKADIWSWCETSLLCYILYVFYPHDIWVKTR